MPAESLAKDASGYQLNADSSDRFGFGFFIALAIHLVLIFGVVFKWIEANDQHADLDVTLVTHYSREAPDEADFLAQSNQQASGTKEQVLMPTSVDRASRSESEGLSENLSNYEFSAVSGDEYRDYLTSRSPSELTAMMTDQEFYSKLTLDQQSSLRSAARRKLDVNDQEYARRPRIGVFTSVAAKAREDAEYQTHLQESVIAIGNQNYPRQSIETGVFGSLRMKLTILPDGSLESTEITESSGHQILDRAAVKIARLSAPFQPFPEELSMKYDKIVFIRTWQFLPGGLLKTDT